MTYDLLTIGDVSIDEYIKVDDAQVVCDVDKQNCKICFDYSGKIPVEKYEAGIAGNSNNVAIGCAKLGLSCGVYTEMGNDANADKFIAEYKRLGINANWCVKNTGRATNVHQTIVYQGERTILTYHEDFVYKVKDWDDPKWIYYSSLPKNFEAFQAKLVDYIKQNPQIGVGFNPGTYHFKAGVEKLRDILAVTHILFVNKEEAARLGATGNTRATHLALQKLGPKLTVVTNGENGSSAYDGGNLVELGILGGEVVDKTGAGDAHSAGFLAALHYGKSLLEALKWGTINANGVVGSIGSVTGLKTKEEMEGAAKVARFS
ncbi:MAG: hypothetical protein UX73_C0015G0006 [candidate division WWE3 bacterium GW2011_GWC1_47_10]|uniref:Carbohydrate kinase PfkB domain-containing protein n=1 Tax=candidate division WWE3 bacterium GW2011_GWC1_47_10 TaxID=1619122 RepID=A0A0G1R0N5_UNCKA|nr:MAG: hypothetical protein UX73_C0015G0006 [candidate division WWE3 bacterium GW2011_GWC1_47_10]